MIRKRKVKSFHKKFSSKKILLVLFAILIVPIIGIVFKNLSTTKNGIQYVMPTPLAAISITPAIPATNFYKSDYEKTQVDLSQSFFEGHPYPPQLKSIDSNMWVPMKCTSDIQIIHNGDTANTFMYQSDPGGAFKPLPKEEENFAKYMRDYAIHIAGSIPYYVSQCLTQNSTIPIFMAATGPKGNGIYFGSFRSEAVLSSFGTCNTPIGLTTDGTFYFMCGDGEGSASLGLYAVNIYNKPLRIASCGSGMGEPAHCNY